jgi:hypothetical protein
MQVEQVTMLYLSRGVLDVDTGSIHSELKREDVGDSLLQLLPPSQEATSTWTSVRASSRRVKLFDGCKSFIEHALRSRSYKVVACLSHISTQVYVLVDRHVVRFRLFTAYQVFELTGPPFYLMCDCVKTVLRNSRTCVWFPSLVRVRRPLPVLWYKSGRRRQT